MKGKANLLLAATLLATGCKTGQAPHPASAQLGHSSTPATLNTFAPDVAPTNKQILRELFRNQDVSLSLDPSCSGVGTEQTDRDIGDYLSGFLAEQNTPGGGNSIEVSAKPNESDKTERLWLANVTIRHSQGDDVWGWGVSFLMRAENHAMVPGSVRCTGAG